jgi:transposase
MGYIRGMDTELKTTRQERGLALAQTRGKRIKQVLDGKYLVPSATAEHGSYFVDTLGKTCSCPDFETRGVPCKHMWALEYTRNRVTAADGTTTETETMRVTYTQPWAEYNAAQMEEKSRVEILLKGLCEGIVQPKREAGRPGRPRISLADAVYSAAMKTYIGMSGRRSTTDIRECEARGHIESTPHYNSVFRYMERPDMLPLLKTLVEESAAPLKAVETNFAVDATGFATQTYVRWYDFKHGEDRRVQRWIKGHAMIGTMTGVITALEVTEGSVHDSPKFASLVKTTAKTFDLGDVTADKAYLARPHVSLVESLGGTMYVPFKSNSTGRGPEAWRKLWHLFNGHRDEWLTHYHQRSNVESTFSALKRLFGGNLRSRLPAAQFNEVALKALVFNMTKLVHAIHELNIMPPTFWLSETAS